MNEGIKVNVLFADGSERKATISPSAISFVKRYARLAPSLFEGTGLHPFDSDFTNIIAVTRTDHDAIHQKSTAHMNSEFLYDFELCADYDELKTVMETINYHGYDLVSVTQDTRGFYTVFFRRPSYE